MFYVEHNTDLALICADMGRVPLPLYLPLLKAIHDCFPQTVVLYLGGDVVEIRPANVSGWSTSYRQMAVFVNDVQTILTENVPITIYGNDRLVET